MQTQFVLRIAALGGVAAVLLWESSQLRFNAAFAWSLLIVAVLAAAVFATMFRLASDGWQRLERHPDILVPLGIMAGVLTLVNVSLTKGLGMTGPWFHLKLWFVSFPVTVSVLFSLAVHAVFAIWTTVLVVDAVRKDACDLGDSFRRSRPVAIRLAVVLLVGWALGMLLFAIEIPALLGLGFVTVKVLGAVARVVLWGALLGVLAVHFCISLATAALLPIIVESESEFSTTIRRGIAASWQHRRKWFVLLLAQFVLVGTYGVVHFKYDHQSSATHVNTNLDMKLNYTVPWLGDYDYDAAWYSHVMGWLGREPLALATTIVAMLMALLSIVVKLAVVERLPENPDTQAIPTPDSLHEQAAPPMPEPLPDAEAASHET